MAQRQRKRQCGGIGWMRRNDFKVQRLRDGGDKYSYIRAMKHADNGILKNRNCMTFRVLTQHGGGVTATPFAGYVGMQR